MQEIFTKTDMKVSCAPAKALKVNTMTIEKNILAEKTQALLEYPLIMEKTASYAVSEEAAEIIRKANPFYDAAQGLAAKEIVRAIYALKKFSSFSIFIV